MNRKIYFGGSFDPPHYGHLAIARAALAAGKGDTVVWFPAYTPPHKLQNERASFRHRFNMVALLIANEKNMEISDFEYRQHAAISYTYETLLNLEQMTGDKYTLLIGEDSLQSLHTWHNADKLVDYTEIITYPRSGTTTMQLLSKYWPVDKAEKLFKNIIQGKIFTISSTNIKKDMEKSELSWHIIREQLLSPEIIEYITMNHLYTGNTKMITPDEQLKKAKALADFCSQCAEDKLAENPLIIAVGDKSSIADFFVIATANSTPHLTALTSFITRQVREKFQIRPFNSDSDTPDNGGWALIDFGDVIVHLMLPETRNHYALEELWSK